MSITAITIILSFFVSSYITGEKLKTLDKTCDAVSGFTAFLDVSEVKHIKSAKIFHELTKVTEVEIFISDLDGKVIFCGCDEWAVDGLCPHNEKNVSYKILEKVKNEGYSESGNLDGFFDKTLFTKAKVLRNINEDTVGIVFASLSPTDIQQFYKKILWMFFISAIIPLVIMFFAEYVISYRFTKPLRLMAEASRSMAKGDFSKRIPVMGNDEISELAIAFNQMTNSLVQIEGTRRSFVANVSHELKTPMTTIGGFIDGIVDGTIPEDKHKYYLEIVSNEIKRLSRLVQSMLSLAKLESGEMKVNKENFSITDTVFDIVVSFEKGIEEKKLQIIGLDDVEQISVNADKDLIYQVIYNLVDNAVKFTNISGKISFAVSKNNNFTEFSIKNTGEGIEQKDLPFVFERFYKTDKSRSKVKDSTGLGLYIANTIVTIHGGKFSVRSVKNDFTEFKFVLPNYKNN